MTRIVKFTANDAFYRAEANPVLRHANDDEEWEITVFRNGIVVGVTHGPRDGLSDQALSAAFDAVKALAELGMWQPGNDE